MSSPFLDVKILSSLYLNGHLDVKRYA